MIRAKKIFGQHFLHEAGIIEKIISSLPPVSEDEVVVEVGPGKGALTRYLLELFAHRFYAIEIDRELSAYLLRRFPLLRGKLIEYDILQFDFEKLTSKKIVLIGNFPYNISSQIIFKVIVHRQQIKAVVGMFQKEMARRVVAAPGNKDYGIPSVLVQAYYDTQYLFDVEKGCFTPPPQVISGVIRLLRNTKEKLDCDESLFFQVVKTSFNQRRKMLRNSLSQLASESLLASHDIFSKRPEQLSVDEFVMLTRLLSAVSKSD